MTLLGGFSMGSSEPSASMDMSLDDMIANRRRSTRSSSKSSSAAPDANKVSNVDRSIATSRAKRTAALRARRGLSTNRKATQMEIEAEVQKQGQKTLLEKSKKAQAQKKLANRGRVSAEDRAEIRKERRRLAREAAKAKKEELANKGGKKKAAATTTVVGGTVAETAPLGRPPSKKAVKAAVSAMEDKGFTIPNGYQMVISFAPADGATTSETSKGGGGRKNNNNNNAANNKGGKQRGGRK